MKGISTTIIFVIAIFIIGAIAIYVYEHFRYSPFALQVDEEVVKEYLLDRHVEMIDLILKDKIKNSNIQINKRLSAYEFALEIAPMLSVLQDGVTRIEIPLKATDKTLPMKCKYINGKVVVSMSYCEIPVGSVILSINGYPIEDIIKRYKNLFPTLNDFQQEYSFVDKILPYYPKIIDAQTLQVKYQLPNTLAQRTSYIKGIPYKEFQQNMHVKPIELYNISKYTVVRIKSFNVSNKSDMTELTAAFDELIKSSKAVIFDLRYANDGDITLPSMIISKLITRPTTLYPKLISRYKFKQIIREQIPVEPEPEKLTSDVYFLVDKTCFYNPHKTLLAFLATNRIGKLIILDNSNFSDLSFYTEEFFKILPNTRTYIVMPLSKVVVDSHFENEQIAFDEEIPFNEKELTNNTLYKEFLKRITSMIE